jgi:hypothetical protein
VTAALEASLVAPVDITGVALAFVLAIFFAAMAFRRR